MRLLSRRVNAPLWSIVVLFAIAVVISVATYFAEVHNNQASERVQRQQAAQQAAAQRAQGEALERKLCTSLGDLAALKPPPGDPGDLSRAYLLEQHQVLAELGPDVGCGTAKR